MAALTSRERVAKAFAHQEPDRVPLFELSIDSEPASALMGREMWVGGLGANAVRANRMAADGAGRKYADRERQDTIALWRALELDMLIIPRPDRLERWSLETLGEYHWRFTEPGTEYWEEFVYTPYSNTYAQVQSSLDQADLTDFEEFINLLEEMEYRLEDYDLEVLDRWMEGLNGIFVLMGADVDYPPTSKTWGKLFLECLILRPDLIDRYLDVQMKSRYLMINEAGKVMVKHTDGDIRQIESILLEESGIDGWHPVDPTVGLTISDYKQRYGKQITLIGNVNCATTLVSGTLDDVINETKSVIRAGAPCGGFILSSSNSIHAGVKPELYQAMLETARAFGHYPIERVNR
jgi:uroporphyrinogen decarboxylase